MSGLLQIAQAGLPAGMPTMVTEASEDFIFGLDWQFLFDAVIFAAAMLVLYALLSFLLFNPARKLFTQRQEMIDNNIKQAKADMQEANALKIEYQGKLADAQKEADEILSQSRKKAIKRENEIVDDAKQEARRIIERADKEAELEKSKLKDEVKNEMISVAAAMAGKFVAQSLDETKQSELINETLKEMGDETWQN